MRDQKIYHCATTPSFTALQEKQLKYLGQLINEDGKPDTEIRRRTEIARKNVTNMKATVVSRKWSLETGFGKTTASLKLEIQQRKMRYFGRILRADKIQKILLTGKLEGKMGRTSTDNMGYCHRTVDAKKHEEMRDRSIQQRTMQIATYSQIYQMSSRPTCNRSRAPKRLFHKMLFSMWQKQLHQHNKTILLNR